LYTEGSTRPILTEEVTGMFEHKKRTIIEDEEPIEGGSLMKKLKNRKLLKNKHNKGKKVIFGSGLEKNTILKKTCRYYEYDNPNNVSLKNNQNVFLELTKLKNNNILSIKYKSTRNNHPKFVQQRISQTLSDIIQDILNGNLDERLLKILNQKEKVLLNQFLKISKINDIILDKNELLEYNKQFDILMGELESGNNNPDIKRKLKEYIYTGIKLGRLSKTEGFELLLKL
jgi:hypothetical protein